jgi:molybdopterin converting factor small subunit
MAIEVRIPAVMRANTAGEAVVLCEGESVDQVLVDLTTKYPDLKDVLFSEENSLHKYVNIYLDSEDIRYIGGLDAKIGEAKELTILPAVAGGF